MISKSVKRRIKYFFPSLSRPVKYYLYFAYKGLLNDSAFYITPGKGFYEISPYKDYELTEFGEIIIEALTGKGYSRILTSPVFRCGYNTCTQIETFIAMEILSGLYFINERTIERNMNRLGNVPYEKLIYICHSDGVDYPYYMDLILKHHVVYYDRNFIADYPLLKNFCFINCDIQVLNFMRMFIIYQANKNKYLFKDPQKVPAADFSPYLTPMALYSSIHFMDPVLIFTHKDTRVTPFEWRMWRWPNIMERS